MLLVVQKGKAELIFAVAKGHLAANARVTKAAFSQRDWRHRRIHHITQTKLIGQTKKCAVWAGRMHLSNPIDGLWRQQVVVAANASAGQHAIEGRQTRGGAMTIGGGNFCHAPLLRIDHIGGIAHRTEGYLVVPQRHRRLDVTQSLGQQPIGYSR